MFVLVDDSPGVGSIGYDDSLQAVIMTWFKTTDDAFVQERLETELRLVVERRLRTIIVDTSQVKGVLSQDIQAWIAADFFPRLSRTGLRALVTVKPQSAIAMLTNNRSFVGADVPFDILHVDTLADAYRVAEGVLQAPGAQV